MSDDFVRPFVMTGGRTRAADTSLRVETLVQTSANARRRGIRARAHHPAVPNPALDRRGLRQARPPARVLSRVLVGDLVAEDRLIVHHNDPVDIELSVLTRMIDRVRSL